MRFEDALKELRAANPIYNKSYDTNGEYWVTGYVTWLDDTINEKKLTIHRMNKNGKPILDANVWGLPRWLIMSEDWEVK